MQGKQEAEAARLRAEGRRAQVREVEREIRLWVSLTPVDIITKDTPPTLAVRQARRAVYGERLCASTDFLCVLYRCAKRWRRSTSPPGCCNSLRYCGLNPLRYCCCITPSGVVVIRGTRYTPERRARSWSEEPGCGPSVGLTRASGLTRVTTGSTRGRRGAGS